MTNLRKIIDSILDAVLAHSSLLKSIQRDVQHTKINVISNSFKLDLILTEFLPELAVGFIFTVVLPDGQILEGEHIVAKIKNHEQFTASIKPVDKLGNLAKVDGIPSWAASDDTKIAIFPAPDGLSALIKAVGPLTADGSPAQYTVTGDADLGEGVTPIFGQGEVIVEAGDAVGFTISESTPVAQGE